MILRLISRLSLAICSMRQSRAWNSDSVLRQIADARQVDRDHADRPGHRIGAEQAAAALAQLAGVQPQAAAHGDGVLRRQVGIDVVGEIRDAVFAGDLHELVDDRAVPVEILRDVDRRDREGEHAALGVALQHDVAEGLVEEVHLRLEIAVDVVR